ncbi:D-sedoheptulose-7-phosphate isomerase [Candidatus Pelagibacter sp. HIMB123]|uniref:D-sedoheptulose-7-phosphate isomerase n=1 Tax=Candidatus Pelagibacter sp. HIMB123 TaxID=3415413 RepID=UPI003F8714BC
MDNIKSYFKTSSENIKNLINHEEKIIEICNEIKLCSKNKKKLLVAGNGGSCSDAEHFTGELQCTYKKRDRKPISAISLASLPAAITAWSNDFGFETFFSRQVEAHGNEGDILFLISTGGGNKETGASMSLVNAAMVGKKNGLKVISLIGKSGGVLKNISDISIHVESKITSFIQEAHISLLHCICENLEDIN